MKKIFFLKSSSSHGGEKHETSVTRKENKTMGSQNVDNKLGNSEYFLPVCDRKVTETKTISKSSAFRRSRTLSMSSAAFYSSNSSRLSEGDLSGLRNRHRCPSSHGECDCSDCHFQLKDRNSNSERYNATTTKRLPVEILCNQASSSPSNPSSPQTSFGSTSISSHVVDLHMNDDHHHHNLGRKDHRPTRVHSRVSSDSNLFVPCHSTSRDSLRSEHKHDSPRKLAKDVVEKLLRLEQFRDLNPSDISPNWPPMPRNVCDKHLDEQSYPPRDDMSRKGCALEEFSLERDYNINFFEENEDVVDLELRRKLEEVKHKAKKLSRELAQERPSQFNTVNLPNLSHMMRNLLEEKRSLVLELSDHLQCRISERDAAKKEALLLKEEMNSAIMVKESEKEKLRSQLQREMSAFDNKKIEYTDKLSQMEANLKDLIAKLDETRSENDNLRRMLSDVKNKLEISEKVEFNMERNFKEREKENAELIKTSARVRGICSEQEKTIDGLRLCLNSEIEKRQNSGDFQNVTRKLQSEQLRLSEVEQILRRQLESFTVEVESLRTENIYLLERLKGIGEVNGRSRLKLDQELSSCVHCLKNMGLSLLNDSVQTCEELLKIFGRKESHSIVQYDNKVQGFKQGLEELTRNLGKASTVLKEKAELEHHDNEFPKTDNRRLKNMNQVVLEDDLMSELKAESLLTSILKEKLYSKEKEVERVHGELARALRSHDALKSEIEDAFDTISCLNHKMKNFELQMIEKDGTINQLRGEVGSQAEELGSTRRTLSKVSQERDLMWEEVKQYSEKNMLLNREVNSLKKKIDALEEDTLLKDGQMSILKDSLSNARPFNVLFGGDQGNLFKL